MAMRPFFAIPAKAGIHFKTMSYAISIPRITTRIHDFAP
jgi:hypothetical protein